MKTKIFFLSLMVFVLFTSCQNKIQIDDSSNYIISKDKLISFGVRNDTEANDKLSISNIISRLGSDADIEIYEITDSTGNLQKVNSEINFKTKTISGNFIKDKNYVALNPLNRTDINRYKLMDGLSRIEGFNFPPDLCHYILCSNLEFDLGQLFNDFLNVREIENQLPFQNQDFKFPPIPIGPPSSSNICDQCDRKGGILKLNLDQVAINSSRCNLKEWLRDHTLIRNSIVWRKNNLFKYDDWTESQKLDLQRAFNKLKDGNGLRLNAEPNHTTYIDADEVQYTLFAEDDAWEYYVNYLAHTLYVEICKKVNWTITNFSEDELFYILDSKSMFEYISALERWAIVKLYVDENILFHHGTATPGSPDRVFKFLINERILGNDQVITVQNLIEWCRDNMAHYYNKNTTQNLIDHWGYDGFPPIENIIHGTTHPVHGFQHWTAGCWGTTGFLRYVLRTINIPVHLNKVCFPDVHALPGFPTIDKYLSHGDDPYSKLSKESSGADLLIDQVTFNAWFVNSDSACENIARRTAELALQLLPKYILGKHCEDLDANSNHAESKVFQSFKNHYTIQELENMNLWQRMDAKLSSLGGCASL